MLLDKNVRSIMLQFHTKNPNTLCPSLRWANDKPLGGGSSRGANGKLVIPPTERCYTMPFLTALEEQYVLVDAFKKKRNHHGNVAYIMRYIFTRKELVIASAVALNDEVQRDLHRLCAEDMWRIQIHNNPYSKGSERVVSVNYDSREMLYYADGQSVMVRSLGGKTVPLRPKYSLLITNGKIEII